MSDIRIISISGKHIHVYRWTVSNSRSIRLSSQFDHWLCCIQLELRVSHIEMKVKAGNWPPQIVSTGTKNRIASHGPQPTHKPDTRSRTAPHHCPANLPNISPQRQARLNRSHTRPRWDRHCNSTICRRDKRRQVPIVRWHYRRIYLGVCPSRE